MWKICTHMKCEVKHNGDMGMGHLWFNGLRHAWTKLHFTYQGCEEVFCSDLSLSSLESCSRAPNSLNISWYLACIEEKEYSDVGLTKYLLYSVVQSRYSILSHDTLHHHLSSNNGLGNGDRELWHIFHYYRSCKNTSTILLRERAHFATGISRVHYLKSGYII